MKQTRAAMIAKIKALLAKTVENGCTEGEALAALEKARAMMAEHAIGDDDVNFGGEQCIRDSTSQDDRDRIRQSLATGVAAFCECRTWTGPGFEQINFCGLEGDVGFAHWLLDTLAAFVRRELAAYLRATWAPTMGRVRRLETAGFVGGCCRRIAERLHELAPKPAPGNGRDLVLAKGALIDRTMQDLGIKLRDTFHRKRIDRTADAAGERAGDHAQFNRPVDGCAPMGMIGRR
ncbi:DUF2786 domain-containing protein [Bradyrhizobium sp. USDA 4452]